jgi:hypothetical protein
MQKLFTKFALAASLLAFSGATVNAQMPGGDSVVEFKPSGKLWGYAFGDYAYKGGTDEVGRGGSNQYTKVPVNTNVFQWRRIYLGYDYNISEKFSAEFLLAAEDDFGNAAGTNTTLPGTGDILSDSKFAPYVKLANIRWKKFFKGTDLVLGQSATPTFAKNGSGMASEEVWAYRSIERTITDIRRTGSFDMGAKLEGKYMNDNIGYVLMMGDGAGAKAAGNSFKWFYGDIWAKFMNKKLIVDLYQDYYRLNWSKTVAGPQGMWYNDRNMTKLFVAYSVPKLTVGVEYFMNTLMGDVAVKGKDGNTYYRTTKATGLSIFTRGKIYKEKLGFFARYDNYDPTGNLSNIVNDANTKSYTVTTSQYDPTTKEQFVTFGLDYTPIKNVHIMPNIWMNTYKSGLDATATQTTTGGLPYSGMNGGINNTNGTDLVYRLTFYYIYGK